MYRIIIINVRIQRNVRNTRIEFPSYEITSFAWVSFLLFVPFPLFHSNHIDDILYYFSIQQWVCERQYAIITPLRLSNVVRGERESKREKEEERERGRERTIRESPPPSPPCESVLLMSKLTVRVAWHHALNWRAASHTPHVVISDAYLLISSAQLELSALHTVDIKAFPVQSLTSPFQFNRGNNIRRESALNILSLSLLLKIEFSYLAFRYPLFVIL